MEVYRKRQEIWRIPTIERPKELCQLAQWLSFNIGLISWDWYCGMQQELILCHGYGIRSEWGQLSIVSYFVSSSFPKYSGPAMLWCNEPSALHFLCMIMWRAAAAIIRELFAIICRICNGIIMSRTDRSDHTLVFLLIFERVHGICVYLCAWCIWPIDSWVFEFHSVL